MQIRQLIEESLEVFQESKKLGDSDIADILMTRGISKDIAWKIVVFVPLAFSQVMLQPTGVGFSKTYSLRRSNGQMEEEKELNDEPFFQEAIAVAESKVGVNTGDLWLSVAGRSAVCHVINKLLLKGSHLENIRLTPAIIQGWD